MNYDGYLASHPPGTVLNNYSGECVSNIANYLDFNGLHSFIAYANAKDWADNGTVKGAFTWIANNPNDYNQVPARGDIIVWSGALPGSGGYGHIAIWDRVVSPGVFSSYDNNWGGRYLHFVNHNWSYVLGWYTRKISAPPAPSGDIMDTDDKVKRQYNTLRGNEGSPAERAGWLGKPYDQFNQTAVPEVNSRTQSYKDSQVQIANLTRINNETAQQLVIATDTANTTKAERDAAVAKSAELQAELTTAIDKLKEAQTPPVVPPQDTISETRFKQFIKWVRELLGIED